MRPGRVGPGFSGGVATRPPEGVSSYSLRILAPTGSAGVSPASFLAVRCDMNVGSAGVPPASSREYVILTWAPQRTADAFDLLEERFEFALELTYAALQRFRVTGPLRRSRSEQVA